MTFSIADFIAEINKNGTQLNSKYEVIIPIPNVLINKYNLRDGFADVSFMDQAKILSMRCENATMPGVALRSNKNNRYGVGVFEQTPFSAGFTDNTNLVFIADKNGNINNFWYSWLNLICNFADSNELFGGEFKQYTHNYKNDYVSNIIINKFDDGGNKIQTVILNGAFPMSIHEQPLTWNNEGNQLSKTIIGVNFRDWHYEGSGIRVNDINTETPIR
jgi:hypothetical protein